MCYSAQIERDYGRYLRVVGPDNALSKEDFVRKYWERQHEFPSMKIPKAVDAWFANPRDGDEQKIAAFVEDFNDKEISKLEQELFKQKKRLADAERSLQAKETKKGLERSAHRVQQNRLGPGQTRRHQARRIQAARRAHLPGLVRASHRKRERPPHREAHALPVPSAGEAEVLTTRNILARTTRAGTAWAASGRIYSDIAADSCSRRSSTRT